MRESEISVGNRVRLLLAGACIAICLLPARGVAEPAASVSEPVAAPLPAAESAASVAAAAAAPVDRPSASFEQAFYQAYSLVLARKFGEASQHLTLLRTEASSRGVRNLPKFALDLIDRAQTVAAGNQPEEVTFLIGQAIKLAPDEPRVWFGAATFGGVVGVSTALGYWWRGLVLLPGSPVLAGGVGAGVLLAVLVATTLGLLVVSLLMVMRNIDALFERAGRYLPFNHRAIGGSVLVVVMLILPLVAGILPAIAVWSLFVAASDRRMRFAAFLSGALVLCWALALPTLVTVLLASRSPASVELERLQHSSYTPGAAEALKEALRVRPTSAVLLFALGEVAWYDGKIPQAGKLFAAAREHVGTDQSLRSAIDISEAAVLHSNGQHADARQLLLAAEARGARGEELYHNLSLVSLAALDTAAAEQYATHARAYHVGGAEEPAGVDGERAKGPMIATLPGGSVGQTLFWHPGTMLDRERSRRSAELGAALLVGGSPLTIGILGLLTLAAAAMVGKGRRARRSYTPPRATGSRIWAVFPGGRLVMGGSPRAGLFIMVAVFLCALLLIEAPVRVPGLSVIEAPRHYPLMLLMAVLFLAGLRTPAVEGASDESAAAWQGGDE